MQCPYCGESIKDGAVVCRHCRRDLSFFRPLLERLESLEARLGELPAATVEGAPAGRPVGGAVLVVVAALCLLTTAATLWAAFVPWRDLYQVPYYLMGLVPPLLFGLLLGARRESGGSLRLFNLGLVLGVLNLAAALAILANVEGVALNWPWILVVFVVGQPAIVGSAGWIARRLTRRPLSWGRLKELLQDVHFLLGVLAQIAAQLVSFQSLSRLFGGGS